MSLLLPSVIGHRGACAYAPENTLSSIHAAADMGVKWVEVDVKLSRDGTPILMHDDTLDRTTNGSGTVADMAIADILELDAGSWFADSFVGEGVPTLESALDVVLQRGLGINLEIKPCPGREIETAEALLDVISRIYDSADGLLLSSFTATCLETAKDMAPVYPRGLLLPTQRPDDWAEIADYLDVVSIHFDGRPTDLTRDAVEALFEGGRKTMAYTIDDPARARLLYGWGVDCVCSNTPDVILGNLN